MPKIKCTKNYVISKLSDIMDEIHKATIMAMETGIKPNEVKFTQMVNARLNTILRMQQPMTLNEALQNYTSDKLHKKFIDVLEIVDYININGCMYIVDKTTMCAFMGITLSSYQFLLQDASVDPSVQQIMQNIEDYLIGQAQQSTELKIRQDKSVERRMSMKGEYGGNEMEIGKNANKRIINVETNRADLQKKLNTTYNFIESGDDDAK